MRHLECTHFLACTHSSVVGRVSWDPLLQGGPTSQAEAVGSPGRGGGQAQGPASPLQEGSPPSVRTAKGTRAPLPTCLLRVSGGENSGSLSPHPGLAYGLTGWRLPAARKTPRTPGLPGPAPQHMVVTYMHTQSCATLGGPRDCSPRLLCPRDAPGRNTGAGGHALLQGIFLTQGSNLHALHRQADPLPPEPSGKPTQLARGGSLLCEKWALSPGLSSGAERQLRAEGLKGVGGELTDMELSAPGEDRVT